MHPVIGISSQINTVSGNPFVDWHYIDFIRDAGGTPVIFPPVRNRADAAEICATVDGILIPGGDDMNPELYGQTSLPETYACVPSRDVGEMLLLSMLMEDNLPVLGICRGAQIINVAGGGSIIQDLPKLMGLRHAQETPYSEPFHGILVEPDSPLAAAVRKYGLELDLFPVNSIHHQAIAPPVAPALRLMAQAQDGTVEAVYKPDHDFFWGVQWHPELMPESPLSRIIANELIAAAERRARNRGEQR